MGLAAGLHAQSEREGGVTQSPLAAVDALSDIRHPMAHPIRPAWQEELGSSCGA
jgi:hypothetical protein